MYYAEPPYDTTVSLTFYTDAACTTFKSEAIDLFQKAIINLIVEASQANQKAIVAPIIKIIGAGIQTAVGSNCIITLNG